MISYPSLRFHTTKNQIYPRIYSNQITVEKHFDSISSWHRESDMFQALAGRLPVPTVLKSETGLIITEFCPHPTFLSMLGEQGRAGFSSTPWIALARWLQKCFDLTGNLPGSADFRNFLWDADREIVYGLDFEEFIPCSLEACGARYVAHLMVQSFCSMEIRNLAAGVLSAELHIPQDLITNEVKAAKTYRDENIVTNISGIILAGGKSSRMGCDKSELRLQDKPLLQWQIEKMHALGITDIIVSGANCRSFPGTRIVSDEYPDRGPLGGLHASLKHAKNPRCLVLGVDIPLIPTCALAHLCRSHSSGITVLRHACGVEPLIGVYDSSIHHCIVPLIEAGGAPVHALKKEAAWDFFDYLGPSEYLTNCNSQEDFSRIKAVVDPFSGSKLFF